MMGTDRPGELLQLWLQGHMSRSTANLEHSFAAAVLGPYAEVAQVALGV
jgi:hypothetical protein